jgi:hypothetical protein
MGLITVIGIVVAAGLIAVLMKFLAKDKIDAVLAKRKSSTVLGSAAEYVEGPQHIEVGLSIDKDTIHYENADISAHFDLKNIEEVVYDDDLATGARASGVVLRLRSHGHTFEFVMTPEEMAKWKKVLPPHRADEPGEVHVEPVGAGAAS